jgi:hypothetical protein
MKIYNSFVSNVYKLLERFYRRVLKILPFLNYVSALNLKIKSSVLDSMPVANTMSPAGEVAGFQYLRRRCGKTCPEYWQ